MALFASSYIPTVAAPVTRNADSLNFSFAAVPQALTIYLRFLEMGTANVTAFVLNIGGAGSPQFNVVALAGGVYVVRHITPTGSISATLGVGPAIGNLVELVASLATDGSVTIQQSINGGAVTSASSGGVLKLAQAWSAATLGVNDNGAGGFRGWNILSRLLLVRGVQPFATMQRVAGVN